MQRGRNVAAEGGKKIDVLPVEVRAMAFRVQAGILSSCSRPEGTKQQSTKYDRERTGRCTRYSFLPLKHYGGVCTQYYPPCQKHLAPPIP